MERFIEGILFLIYAYGVNGSETLMRGIIRSIDFKKNGFEDDHKER